MPSFLNITYKKVGGIHWLQLGRINFSFCITNRATYARKQHMKALQSYQASVHHVLALATEF